MNLTSHLFEGYIKCPMKCWLRSLAEPAGSNRYCNWERSKREMYRKAGSASLSKPIAHSNYAISPSVAKGTKVTPWRLGLEVDLRVKNMETQLHAVEQIRSEVRGRPSQFIPIRFEHQNILTPDHKLLLAYDCLALSETLGREVRLGKLIHGDNRTTMKMKTANLARQLRGRIAEAAALLTCNSPPDLELNQHCPQCEFQATCRQKAIEKDDIGLLSGMSIKERRKLNEKGIFTIRQLSYTFRPRRRGKNLHDRKKNKYHHALKALAIRAGKIHTFWLVESRFEGTPVYLDVEGLPDRDFYYLIGIRIVTGTSATQHSFWADTTDDENQIWSRFLHILATIPNPVLFHYGGYETKFFKRMRERTGEPKEGTRLWSTIAQARNLLAVIFAQIYFPTLTNGLKDIANSLGSRRCGSPSSGLESIMWRHLWEATGDITVKKELIDYNKSDCEDLELVTNALSGIHRGSLADREEGGTTVVDASQLRREHPYGFKRNAFIYPELEAINKAAYWDYQRERIYFKSGGKVPRKRAPKARRRRPLRPNKSIENARPTACPRCGGAEFYRHGKRHRTIIDLKFVRHGVKRWVTRYTLHRYLCNSCGATFSSAERTYTRGKYGPNLLAYAVYQNVELGVPQIRLESSLALLFDLDIGRGRLNRFKTAAARLYQNGYDELIQGLCQGNLLHVDETRISVRGKDGYVWVLASMKDVAYFYTPTREGQTMQTLLRNFKGVLVSDFFAVYDSISCPQQKCLIHLIRDLNDALLKFPYDEDLRDLVKNFGSLSRSIVHTVHRHGLKTRFLMRYRGPVERFYASLYINKQKSDCVKKIEERLIKNKDKLFTFLDFDDVPWNNNNAEHAVKAFVTLRRVIDGTTSEKGLRDYLILLSLRETCKYRGLKFLDFLRSGETDVRNFAAGSLYPRPMLS